MTERGQDPGSAAHAALVSALVGLRPDPASARFDRELAEAEAAGTVDPAVARTLRWWQRESVRGVGDHLTRVLPEVLALLAAAEREALEAVESSAAAWDAATGSPGGPPPPPAPGPRGPGTPTTPSAPLRPGAHEQDRPPVDPGGAPYLRPVDVAGTERVGPMPRRGGSVTPGFAPSYPTSTPEPPLPASTLRPDDPVAHHSSVGGAPSPRLLVSGLSVLTDDDPTSAGEPTAGRPEHHRTSTPHHHVPGTSG